MKENWKGINKQFKDGKLLGYDVGQNFGKKGTPSFVKGPRRWFGKDALFQDMRTWLDDELAKYQHLRHGADSFGADIQTFLDSLPEKSRKRHRYTQQLHWWAMQPAKLGASALSVKQLQQDATDIAAGRTVPDRGPRLASLPSRSLDVKRIRQILEKAFAASNPDKDPAENAATSNHYRNALGRFFEVLTQDDKQPYNPVRQISTRTAKKHSKHGTDMRLVLEILKHVPSKYAREDPKTALRMACLAWIPIRPVQLMKLDPKSDFFDITQATRDQQIDGMIRLRTQPHLKGRRQSIPEPAVIPLTPYGVEAMRAFADSPTAWGDFSTASLNKAFKQAAQRCQTALKEKGIVVDLSRLTLYQLKHSLVRAMMVASAGIIDEHGNVKVPEGVRETFQHESPEQTQIYGHAACDELLLIASKRTALWLDQHLAQPLVPTPKTTRTGTLLRRVK